MSATVTITDNADGTGATAVVAGTSGAGVVAHVGQTTGLVGSVPFSFSFSRTGDGSLPFAITRKGLYFAYTLVGGLPVDLSYFAVTDGKHAVATRVRAAVVSTIKSLLIPPALNVYEQMFPDETNVKFPCVICTVDGTQESEALILNNHDDIGRPVKVMIADRADKWEHRKLPDYELWRQSIDRCFRNQQLIGVPESVVCKIEPYVIVDPNARQYQHMVSGFVVRAVCRETRGIGS